jgi:hypothetical protein
MRQRDCRSHGLVEHHDTMVSGKGGDQPSHHVDGLCFCGLHHLQRLEAPGQRGIFLDVALVLGPGGGTHRAQRASRERWFEKVGRIAGSGLPARADQGVHFVDEENHRLHGFVCLLEQRLQARLELASHAGPREERTDVETQQACVAQRRRHIAAGNGQRQALDHGGLADARLSRQQRIVLAAPQENVDHRADFMPASDDRIDLAAARALGQVGAIAAQRGRDFGGVDHGATGLARHGRGQARAVVRAFIALRRARDDGSRRIGQFFSGNAPECRRDAEQRIAQLRRLQQGRQQPCTANAAIAELEACQYPCAFDGGLDVVREVDERSCARWQHRQRRRHVPFHSLRIDLVVLADAMQIAVAELPELMHPVHQFDMGIASKPCKGRRRLDAAKQREVEFAEQGPARDRHLANPRPMAVHTPSLANSRCEPRADRAAFLIFLPTPRSLCFLE